MFKQVIIIIVLIVIFNILNIECLELKPIEILVVGSAGYGKSSLINFLMNKEVAYVSHDDTGTRAIHTHGFEQYGFKFKIYDTPGLNDSGNDDNNILKMIMNSGPMLNIILLCFDISSPRTYTRDTKMKNIIIDAFGEDILNYVLVVYTKANLANEKKLYDLVNQRHKKLNLEGLPYFLAYDNDHPGWISNLWFKMLDHSKKNPNIFNIFNAGTKKYKRNTNNILK